MKALELTAIHALQEYDRNVTMFKLEFGLSDLQVQELIKAELVQIELGQGFCGGIRNIRLTAKGKEFIKSFCSVCECMPCDCGYGS
jgi:hypothetical protein